MKDYRKNLEKILSFSLKFKPIPVSLIFRIKFLESELEVMEIVP